MKRAGNNEVKSGKDKDIWAYKKGLHKGKQREKVTSPEIRQVEI